MFERKQTEIINKRKFKCKNFLQLYKKKSLLQKKKLFKKIKNLKFKQTSMISYVRVLMFI